MVIEFKKPDEPVESKREWVLVTRDGNQIIANAISEWGLAVSAIPSQPRFETWRIEWRQRSIRCLESISET
jgi:hypothetical protein